ncbi:hypothetical protein Cgig2_020760 [Carnegiea gigantea]|uniref:Uncharacterized protein n=1 Tax=Carnegiea gigantea TaxID=171969 RepID=A0A9Q1QAM7_9CARY|nr:hypothetical protein Cgig2_020760 [Carnegiea gigantea]
MLETSVFPRCPMGVFLAIWYSARMDEWHHGVGPQEVTVEHLLGMGEAQQEQHLTGHRQETYSDRERRRTRSLALPWRTDPLVLRGQRAITYEARFSSPSLERQASGLRNCGGHGLCREPLLGEWYLGSVATSRGVLSFTLPAPLYNDGVGLLVEGHLITLPNPFIEREKRLFRERISTLFYIMVFSDFLSTEQAADYIRETSKWHLRGVVRPPRPLPANYHKLRPYFDLVVVEEAARDFRILEMIQAIFYAMVVNEALKLGVLSRDLAEHLKLCLEGLQRYMCEAWL